MHTALFSHRSIEKHAALPALLPLVRWPRVAEERRADIFALTARLRPPRMPLDGTPSAPLAAVGSPAVTPIPSACGDSELDEDHLDATDREDRSLQNKSHAREKAPRASSSRGSPWEDAETEATLLVRELFPEASVTPVSDGGLGPERQYFWGELVSRSPPPPPGQVTPPGSEAERTYPLQSTKEYMVGRSRKSDIRVGHQAPMPYISSQHFRVYPAIRWPDVAAEGTLSSEDEHAAPVIQAWIEDLSQNGTYINGTQLGKNKSQVLNPGDRIEMVFPLGRQPTQQPAHNFPIFTFQTHPSTLSTPSGLTAIPIGSTGGGVETDDPSQAPAADESFEAPVPNESLE